MIEKYDDEMVKAANARLILMLINHIGDQDVVEEAMVRAALSKENPQ